MDGSKKGSLYGYYRWKILRMLSRPNRHIVWKRIQRGAWLRLSWNIVPEKVPGVIGKAIGPSACLFIYGKQVLRFDPYGAGGHFHTNVWEQDTKRLPARRFFYAEKKSDEQIDRAADDLTQKLNTWLAESEHPKIRAFKPDAARFDAAARFMREKLKQYNKAYRTP